MLKRIFSLVLIISLFSVGSCFAFDTGSVSSIWDKCTPKISEYWNKTLTWIDSDMKPWLEKTIGTKTKQEFEREFAEVINDVPTALKAIWDKTKEILK